MAIPNKISNLFEKSPKSVATMQKTLKDLALEYPGVAYFVLEGGQCVENH